MLPKQEIIKIPGQIATMKVELINSSNGKVYTKVTTILKQDASYEYNDQYNEKTALVEVQFFGSAADKVVNDVVPNPDGTMTFNTPFQKGQNVIVTGKLEGRTYINKSTGEKGFFQSFGAFKIEHLTDSQTAQTPNPIAQPQTAVPAVPVPQAQPQAQPNWSNSNTQTTAQKTAAPTTIEDDDLPF